MKLRLFAATLPALAFSAFLACGGTDTPRPQSTASEDAGDGEPVDPDGAAAPSCPETGDPEVSGSLEAPEVDETSGIAVSVKNPGIFWLHNDSGDGARAFAVDEKGKLHATLEFDTVKPRDIEDMAIEDGEGGSFLYFGDIGDNAEARTSLTIHRVAEPKLGSGTALSATSEKMTVVYVDGAHNAETLLFDPLTKDLLIATKRAGGPSAIHRIGAFSAGSKATTEKIAEVDIDLATGGEISRDGKLIAIRSYARNGFLWVRGEGESLADALARPPCSVPLGRETQGETFAFFPKGEGYVTLSEGAGADLHVTMFK